MEPPHRMEALFGPSRKIRTKIEKVADNKVHILESYYDIKILLIGFCLY